MYQLICIVADIHANGWIHRDIKPGNILLNFNIDETCTIQLCDFGSAKPLGSKNRSGHTSYVCTAGYRAPELLQGYTNYGLPVDLWSVGAVFYELLASDDLVPTSVTDPDEDNNDILEYILDKIENELITDSNTITSDETNLLQRLLCLDPSRRITAVEALSHPYFNDLTNKPIYKPFKIGTAPTIGITKDILLQHPKLKLKHIVRAHDMIKNIGDYFELQTITIETSINLLNTYLSKTTGVNATKHIQLISAASLYLANAIYETDVLTFQDLLEHISITNDTITWQELDEYVQLILFHLEGILI
jgi:serine/threonine protein kinase